MNPNTLQPMWPAALAEPFPASDIEWRIARAWQSGNDVKAKCLAYLTNRAIQQRLDDILGPANWRNEYKEAPGGGVMCGLSIRVFDAESEYAWVTKWDGADRTNIEATKGGLSDAMKRAAVQWGIGRYLYHLDEGWANVHPGGARYAKLPRDQGGTAFKWDPPVLPAWALPEGEKPEHNQPQPGPAPRMSHDEPRPTGRQQAVNPPVDGGGPLRGDFPAKVASGKDVKNNTLIVLEMTVDAGQRGAPTMTLFLKKAEGKGLTYTIKKAEALLKREVSTDEMFTLKAADFAGTSCWVEIGDNPDFPIDNCYPSKPDRGGDFMDVPF